MAELSIMEPFSAAQVSYAEWRPYGDHMAWDAARAALEASELLHAHQITGCAHGAPRDCALDTIPEIKDRFIDGDRARSFIAGITLALCDGSYGIEPDDAYEDPGWTVDNAATDNQWR